MNKNPTVSVIIPTYNRANLISRAIRSVLNQTYSDFELIIIDDGSTDNTEDIIRQFQEKDKRIKYIKHDKNKGGSAARNRGIKIAKGKYIAFQDSDDEWLPEKLNKQVDSIEKLPLNIWGGTYCSFYYFINGNTRMIEVTKRGNFKKELLNREVDIGASSTILLSKLAIDKIGLFDESFKKHQDLEYLIRFFRIYKLYCVNQPLVKVYGHNMPRAQEFVEIKKKYLSKFNRDIQEFGNNIAKEIKAKNWLEVAEIFLNERNIYKYIYYLVKSLSYKILPINNYLRRPISFIKKLVKNY